jgi:ATP-dependent helicase/nuclease subunit B
MSEHGVQYHRIAAPACVEYAARLLIDEAAAKLPDLSDVIVILPNLFLAHPLAQRLARTTQHALLLPQFTTFPALAEGEALSRPVVPAARRQALIYDALRRTHWFAAGNLWEAADQLLSLIDELALCSPAIHAPDLARLGSGRLFDIEAQLVAALAAALGGGEALEPIAAQRMRLQAFAARAQAPLYAIGFDTLDPLQSKILQRCAERAPVHVIVPDIAHADSARAALLVAAWPEAGSEAAPEQQADVEMAPISERARSLAAAHADSPAREWLSLCDAPTLESTARAVALQVRRWLSEGRTRIALIAQDRFATRRVRALLERDGVLCRDEAGWRLSTTAASAVLMRWLDALASGFAYRELFDFLSSPFISLGLSESAKQSAIAELERIARKENWTRALPDLQQLAAQSGAANASAMLVRLADAAAAFGAGPAGRISGRDGLAHWIELLERSVQALGINRALAGDAAGQQLLAGLAQRREQLQQHDARYSFTQWRDWLSHDIESVYFHDDTVESTVVITHLEAARLREFDALALIGADAEHLFGAPAADYFNERVRAQLGLPTYAQRTGASLRALCDALLLAPRVLLAWQNAQEGAPRAPSPYVERLRTLSGLAYGDAALRDDSLARLLAASAQRPTTTARVAAPAPRALGPRVPAAISAAAYQSLIDCPYQFYARYMLNLRREDEVREAMDKRDFGSVVHDILNRFHQATPSVSALDRDAARARLTAEGGRALGRWQRASAVNRAWQLRWQDLIEAYLDWQTQREAQGWRWHAGEVKRDIKLSLSGERQLGLNGRLDRIDLRAKKENGAGDEHAVIDYKTRDKNKLSKKLNTAGEDVQLLVYAELCGDDVTQVLYLSLEDEKAAEVPLEGGLEFARTRNRERLREMFGALYGGAPLPAQGVAGACEYCEARGLCRRDVWI